MPGLVSGGRRPHRQHGHALDGEATPVAGNDPEGRQFSYGVREHGMGGVMVGMSRHGGALPVGGTFFCFSDYMRGSVRLAALSKTKVIYSWTHDSVGLGEDGPTHQPVEQLAAMRAMPNLLVIRPADANETAQAVKAAIDTTTAPPPSSSPARQSRYWKGRPSEPSSCTGAPTSLVG